MKKSVLIIFLSLISLGIFCPGIRAGSEQDKVKLYLNFPNMPPRGIEYFKVERVKFEAFLQNHPYIEPVLRSGLIVEGQAQDTGFLMSMAGGTAPDIVYVNLRQLHTFAEQGFLYPLDEFIAPNELKELIREQYLPYLTVNGHIYAIPFDYVSMGLYWRKDIFKSREKELRDAGLDPDRAPATWEELFEYAKVLTQPEKGQYGLGLLGGNGAGWQWTNFVWQAGGEMVRKGEDGQWKAVFNEEPGVKALEFYKRLKWERWTRDGKEYRGVCKYYIADAGDYMKDFYDTLNPGAEPKIAMMMLEGSSGNAIGLNFMPSDKVGMALLPKGPSGKYANLINAAMWGMNTGITDPKRRESAWEYIKFMAGDDVKRIVTRMLIEGGDAEFVNPDNLKKFGYEDYIDEVPKDWIDAWKGLIEHGKPEPYAPGYENVQTVELAVPIDTVMTDEKADPREVLTKCVEKVNTHVLGYKDPKIMEMKNRVARIISIGISVGIFGFLGWTIMRYKKKKNVGHESSDFSRRYHVRIHALAWFFMIPAVLSILVWAYLPLMRGLLMAFMDYNIMKSSRLVGLNNFIDAFSSPMFWDSMIRTIYYVVLSLGLGFFVPLITAVFLDEIPKGKLLYRTLYYLPAVTSGIVVMFIWKRLYAPGPDGFLNQILAFIGMPNQLWLHDPKMAMLCVILPGIWAGAGPGSLIYLAALKNIPTELYESAAIESSSFWQRLWNVTIPSLKPLIIINFVGAFIGAFHAMENILVMTGGGPAHATHTIGMEIFYSAFVFLKFGYATAMAWVLGALLIGFTIYQLRIIKQLKFGTTG